MLWVHLLGKRSSLWINQAKDKCSLLSCSFWTENLTWHFENYDELTLSSRKCLIAFTEGRSYDSGSVVSYKFPLGQKRDSCLAMIKFHGASVDVILCACRSELQVSDGNASSRTKRAVLWSPALVKRQKSCSGAFTSSGRGWPRYLEMFQIEVLHFKRFISRRSASQEKERLENYLYRFIFSMNSGQTLFFSFWSKDYVGWWRLSHDLRLEVLIVHFHCPVPPHAKRTLSGLTITIGSGRSKW